MSEGEKVIRIPGRTEHLFQETELSEGQTADVVYLGKPFHLLVKGPKGHRLLKIGKVDDLNLRYQFEPEVDYLILGDTVFFNLSQATKEFKGLRDGEQVVLGSKYPGRFDFKDRGIADRAVGINRKGEVISVTKLAGADNKVTLIVGNPHSSRNL